MTLSKCHKLYRPTVLNILTNIRGYSIVSYKVGQLDFILHLSTAQTSHSMPTFHDGSFKDPLVTGAFKFNMRFKAAVKRKLIVM